MKRIKLRFAGLEVDFTDREAALRQFRELAERGTFPVYIIYGPEGCGKTALLKQVKVMLEEEYNYNVIYVNLLAEEESEIIQYTSSIKDVVRGTFKMFPEQYSRIIDVAINIASQVMKRLSRPRIAVLMDDLFQAVGLDKPERYVKMLLNLIEHSSGDYDKIIVLVSSSEGITQERIGRHSWATFRILWNMSKEGFKISFNEVWRVTGGNPRYLEKLYGVNWDVDALINDLVNERRLVEFVRSLSSKET